MSINRYQLVTRHNPKLFAADTHSPLSVGNGEFVYTADITGMQSLVSDYASTFPLCTMAHWGVHTLPAKYSFADLTQTTYPFLDRTVSYPVHCVPGEEPIYRWLRENPHRANLAFIGLSKNGQALTSAMLSDITQELDLYTGVLHSRYSVDGTRCEVATVCDGDSDTVAFQLNSDALQDKLSVFLAFPFAAPEKSAGFFPAPDEDHEELILYPDEASFASGQTSLLTLRRRQNNDSFYVTVSVENGIIEPGTLLHTYRVRSVTGESLSLSVSFAKEAVPVPQDFASVLYRSELTKKRFWEQGAAIDFSKCKAPEANELERRMILSEYLLSIQSAGSLPPAETGLTCNSWYGKFHLEMHPWHAAWLPLWGHGDLLKKSLAWYETHLPEARENAAKNGFLGARWPKMIDESGIDSPSVIAPLLIWQQPHLIYMCELLYQSEKEDKKKKELLLRYFPLLKETADFMADFAVYSKEFDTYELLAPLIPAQECHAPMDTKNPTFELEYWYYGLTTALAWEERIQELEKLSETANDFDSTPDSSGDVFSSNRLATQKWRDVADKLAVPSPDANGLYPAHENCPDTFTNFNKDHPSMLCAYGLINTGHLDKNVVAATLQKVEECWNYPTLWGWDFAVMAMTAFHLGDTAHALSLLLTDSPKNSYVTNGHNAQIGDDALPLYLPGNGSLLLALAMFAGAYPGAEQFGGFPNNGLWEGIVTEGFPICSAKK